MNGVATVHGVCGRFSLAEQWASRRRGRADWDQEPGYAVQVAGWVSECVAAALDDGGDAPARRDTELVAASLYGMTRVAEVFHEQLRTAGPRWLAPEAFLYYSPHSVLAATALAHRLGGAGTTLLGRRAGGQALRHAVGRLRLGVTPAVVVAGYDAPTPFAAAVLARAGVPGLVDRAEVAALVLRAERTQGAERAGGAGGRRLALARPGPVERAQRELLDGAGLAPDAVRAVRLTADAESDRDRLSALLPAAEVTVQPTASPAVAPLAAVAEASAAPAGAALVVWGSGTRQGAALLW